MKKRLFLLMALVMLSGCNQDSETIGGQAPYQHAEGEFEVSEEDVVLKGNTSDNLDRLEEFIEHVKEGKPDDIRVVRYTIEGDPIIDDLNYDGSEITQIHDNRWDQYGVPDITERTCKAIELTETEGWVNFELTGCEE